MANINLFGKDWTNIVFEGRNKAYGAYKLRQENPKTTLLALLLGVVCIGLAFGGSLAYKSIFGEVFNKKKDESGVEILDVQLPELPEPEEPIEEIKEEPIVEPPKEEPADASKSVQDEKKFTEMDVKKDNEVKKEEQKSQKEFNDDTQSGREDRKGDNEGDFKSKGEQTGGADKGSKGDGKGDKFSEEENPNKVHTFVQKKAAPNEGLQGFFNNFIRKFNAPDVGGNVKEISVRLKFVVEKDGSFTDIQIAGADPHNIGKEAIRVLKSMPKWKPAEHNGKTVRSSFTLPIKVRVNN
ncbi:energy transducer TonB [Paenimyroides aestuarii]|uniref:Energy transducer TonB n=1 Tax=Paenimyroides aestuarii TaxID=2968490 RepID=A0ABY5NT36_9FLAO|nr:energy transducer TonB [Paenimyroides aestuarii]UUV21693.1 energy transducer TonB [Paenimyroides aestuarii]